MLPSLSMGDGQGVIDASVENTFSAQINGRAPVVAYQCGIFKNNATSDLVYDTGIVALDEPFYGADSHGDAVRFEFTIPSNDPLVTPHTLIENGYIYKYKYILTFWWDLDPFDYSKGCVNSYETVFDAKAAPSIAILPFTAETTAEGLPLVSSRMCTWEAAYSQSGVSVLWFKWTLALASDHQSYIGRTKEIYSNSAMRYSYDGLLAGTRYAIQIEAKTQAGTMVRSDWIEFEVSYESSGLRSVVEIMTTSNCGIKVDASSLKYIEGVPLTNEYRYLGSVPAEGHTCIEIDLDNAITFTSSEHFSLNIPLDAEQVWSGYIREDNAAIYYASGTDDDNNDESFYFELSHSGSEPGLVPSETLYPSEDLYPYDDKGGYFLLDVNGADSYMASTDAYYPALHWFVVIMGRDGLHIYAAPLDSAVLEVVRGGN